MPVSVLKVIQPGLGATVQDCGRSGWAHYGLPPGGVMDEHAARWANILVENPPDAPVLELSYYGAKFEVLEPVRAALTGADNGANQPLYRMLSLQPGEKIEFQKNRHGIWTYLAIGGGIACDNLFGTCSYYARALLGTAFKAGDIVRAHPALPSTLPASVAGRRLTPSEQRNYREPPRLRLWRGPQWQEFSEAARERLSAQRWKVTVEIDRVGYRLEGRHPLPDYPGEMISEPVRPGSVQVPADGQPIVTMPDGPTVGGYPKIGLVEPEDLSWLAQCRPGQDIRFTLWK